MDTFSKVFQRRGKSFANLGEKIEARRQPCDPGVIPPTRPLSVGLRRRPLQSFDRAPLALLREPSDHPVLPGSRSTTPSPLPRLRRHPDNNSMGGPRARLTSTASPNYDCSSPQAATAYRERHRSVDPNIVYSEYQHGGLTRFDRKSGEGRRSQPLEGRASAACAELGFAADPSPAQPHPSLLRRQRVCSAATTAATPARDQPRPHPPARRNHSK